MRQIPPNQHPSPKVYDGSRDRDLRPVRVNLIDGVILSVAVEVDAPPVPQRVPRQEPPLRRVVVAVGTQHQPGLGVGLIPPLRPEPPRVARRGRAGARPEGVVEVGGQDGAARVQPLGDVAALVEGVEDAGIGGRDGESKSAPPRRSASTPAGRPSLP